ncbi:hypothetical protein U1Q18_018744 [Sarracenia purpurea var. burkii]
MGWITSARSGGGYKVLGANVVVIVGFLVIGLVAQAAIAAPQVLGSPYSCWGGCLNQCVLERTVPCYGSCLSSCFAHPASDYQYYCQLGCSIQQCLRFSSDGARTESCLENCSSSICNIGT